MKIFKIEPEEYPISLDIANRIGIRLHHKDNQSTDSAIHDWILNNLTGKSADVIFIPVSIGQYHSNFIGLTLGLHIRLTPELGDICRCPIVFYSYVPIELIGRMSEYSYLMFLKGAHFFRIGLDDQTEFMKRPFRPLNDIDFHEFISNITIETPKTFFDDNHSIANVWGAYILNEVAQTNIKIENEYEKNLHFKWLSLKTQVLGKCHAGPLSSNPFLKGKKVALIDDEYKKGWKDILNTIVNRLGGQLIVFEDFRDVDQQTLITKVRNFAGTNKDIDVFLVDLRLFEEDHVSEKRKLNLTGMELISAIKSVNKGNQVMVFTASNKIWNIDEARKVGADGYYIKEPPEAAVTINAYENYKNFIKNLEKMALRANVLKPIWETTLWVIGKLAFQPYSSSSASASLMSAELIKAEYSYFYSVLNEFEDINLFSDEQLRYCVLILQKILEILKDEFLGQTYQSPLLFKNGSQVKNYVISGDGVTYSVAAIPHQKSKQVKYKSLANQIRAIDYQLFQQTNHIRQLHIGKLIKKRNDLIHENQSYNLKLEEIVEWQKHVFDLLQLATKFTW